ncbi:MAG: hypothetical protein NTZ79_03670 [Proteobacteria bacterium]|nr:hypothetical protein [Pseudomonadota bacterium]
MDRSTPKEYAWRTEKRGGFGISGTRISGFQACRHNRMDDFHEEVETQSFLGVQGADSPESGKHPVIPVGVA